MKSKIVRIGNSQGVRLPKLLIEEAHLPEEVEISVVGNTLVISPVRKPREGWEEAFKMMHVAGDDKLLIPDTLGNKFDEEEWEW